MLKLSIFQKKAHYRIPYALNDKLTYPLPTYTDIITMLNTCNVPYHEYRLSIQGLYLKKTNDLKNFYTYTNRVDSKMAVAVKPGTFERFKFSEYLEDVYCIIHIDTPNVSQFLNVIHEGDNIYLGELEAEVKEIKVVSGEMGMSESKYSAYIPDTTLGGTIFYLPRYVKKTKDLKRWTFVNVSYVSNYNGECLKDEDGDCIFLT